MASLTSFRSLLSARAPLLASVRTHLGYIPFEGRTATPPNDIVKFTLELKKANMQAVTKATYTFDPMTENCHSLRNFMFFWNTKKIRRTNLKLANKVSVVDDRSEPTILMNLNDGRDLEIRCGNLTELEIATVVNHYLLPLVKEEEKATLTKSEKGAGQGGKKGGKGKK